MADALVNPQMIINNIGVVYVPNSLKFDLGLGEQTVKATAGGGGTSEPVFFDNVESNVGMVSFDIYTLNLTLELHKDWKALGSSNFVQLQGKNDVNIYFQNMAQTNKTEFEVGNDKMTSFTFEGRQAIS